MQQSIILHPKNRLLSPNGSYVYAKDLQVGHKIFNGVGEPVMICHVQTTHDANFSTIMHKGWFGNTYLHDSVDVCTNKGYTRNMNADHQIAMRTHFQWDHGEQLAFLSTLQPSFELGYVLGAFFTAGIEHHVLHDTTKQLALSMCTLAHARKFLFMLNKCMPSQGHKLDVKHAKVYIDDKYRDIFAPLCQQSHFPENYITTQSSIYAHGVYQGVVDHSKASSHVFPEAYRLAVLSFIVSGNYDALTSSSHVVYFPLVQYTNQQHDNVCDNTALHISLNSLEHGIVCDNMILGVS